MREIIFRGKEKDTPYGPLWRYGDLTHHFNSVLINGHVVDPETVGQFTTQIDDNGKDIYEGDILCVGGQLGTVVYDFDCFQVAFGCGNTSLFRCLFEKSCVVIANVHDSPELLEGKDA